MSQAQYHPLEAILRMCAQAQPQPWYHRVYAQQSGVHAEQLTALLELLWLEGLIQKAPGSPETGPGVTLTDRGREVVEDPEAMRRLIAGQLVRPGDIGGTIRQSLRQRSRPIVTQSLVAANIVVFAIGALLAARTPGLLGEYLMGFINRGHTDAWNSLMDRLGILTFGHIVRGQWWRLLTSTFLHDGVLHLGMNMYALWILGAFVEQTWGRWRYLAMYLLSAWGGSCLAIAYSPGVLGASGAVCGILAVEAMWIVLYGRYLPRSIAQRGRNAMLTNLILMVFISLIPRVSWQGHLGGALAGAAGALAMHFQRFGPTVLRVPAVLALPLMAWGWFAFMQYTRATSKEWLVAEVREFERDLLPSISKTTRAAHQLYNKDAKPLVEQHATRRDEAQTKAVLEALDKRAEELRTLETRLERSGPYRDKQVAEARTTALNYIKALSEACEDTARCLRAGKGWKAGDQNNLEEKWKKADQLRSEWRELLS
jgi:membrane associated rhomboid family serine protease